MRKRRCFNMFYYWHYISYNVSFTLFITISAWQNWITICAVKNEDTITKGTISTIVLILSSSKFSLVSPWILNGENSHWSANVTKTSSINNDKVFGPNRIIRGISDTRNSFSLMPKPSVDVVPTLKKFEVRYMSSLWLFTHIAQVAILNVLI